MATRDPTDPGYSRIHDDVKLEPEDPDDTKVDG